MRHAGLSINRDILLTQFAFLSSISAYIEDGGASRGSYLVTELTPEEILRQRKPIKIDTAHKKFVLSVAMDSRASVAKPIGRPQDPFPRRANTGLKQYGRILKTVPYTTDNAVNFRLIRLISSYDILIYFLYVTNS